MEEQQMPATQYIFIFVLGVRCLPHSRHSTFTSQSLSHLFCSLCGFVLRSSSLRQCAAKVADFFLLILFLLFQNTLLAQHIYCQERDELYF